VCAVRTQQQYKKQNEMEIKKKNTILSFVRFFSVRLLLLLLPTPSSSSSSSMVLARVLCVCVCVCVCRRRPLDRTQTGNVACCIGGGRTQCRDENVHNYVFGRRSYIQHTHGLRFSRRPHSVLYFIKMIIIRIIICRCLSLSPSRPSSPPPSSTLRRRRFCSRFEDKDQQDDATPARDESKE